MTKKYILKQILLVILLNQKLQGERKDDPRVIAQKIMVINTSLSQNFPKKLSHMKIIWDMDIKGISKSLLVNLALVEIKGLIIL